MVQLLDEYFQFLRKGSCHASVDTIEDGSFTLSNDLWRISGINPAIQCAQVTRSP